MRALRCEMLPFIGLTEDEAHCTIGVLTTIDMGFDGDAAHDTDISQRTMLVVDTGSSEGTTAVHVRAAPACATTDSGTTALLRLFLESLDSPPRRCRCSRHSAT
jgi:hypothetical protein